MPNIAELLPASLPLASFSWQHALLLVLAILLLFGGRKLPELARGLARGLRIFRDELHGVKSDVEEATSPPPADGQKKVESKPAEPTQEKKDQK